MKKPKKFAMSCLTLLLMTSSKGWTIDYLKKTEPSPIDGVLMTEPEFRKMSEELFTCDLIKKDLKKDLECDDGSIHVDVEKKYWFFVSGLLVGFIARGN